MGDIGAGLLGLVADAWGVSTVPKLITLMSLVGFIRILMVPDASKSAGERRKRFSPDSDSPDLDRDSIRN